VTRVFGATRYDTAFDAANMLKERLGVQKFETIIVACGTDFADALSGSYLANQKNAPILLVRSRNQEINQVKAYIKANLKTGGTVYLLGGVNAVPKSMETGLEGFTVKRLAGATRYETSLAILKEAGVGNKDILVCTGKNFADGLSASAVNMPIMLVKDSLTATQKAFLQGLNGNKIVIIGGTVAVNTRIENALKAYGTVERIEGATRYYTSVNIAKKYFPNATTMVVAYADNFPDGLSGGPLAYSLNAPLILTMNGKQAVAASYAQEKKISSGVVLGGTTLISDKVVKTIFRMSANETIAVR
jgi:putative cell wall-binding protein